MENIITQINAVNEDDIIARCANCDRARVKTDYNGPGGWVQSAWSELVTPTSDNPRGRIGHEIHVCPACKDEASPRIPVTIQGELRLKLDAAHRKSGAPRSEIIRRALEAYLSE